MIATAGDEVAVEIIDRVAAHLARAIRSLALTRGVKRVVIGGGVAAAASWPPDLPFSNLSDRASPADARPRHWSRPRRAMRPSSRCRQPRAPGARGAAAIARHHIGLPEREGVGER
jgi:predicted NBD/HSP70 family sugar kinase